MRVLFLSLLLSGCGYTIKSHKELRQENFYQFHLGKLVAYENCHENEKAVIEYETLQEIRDRVYEGLW